MNPVPIVVTADVAGLRDGGVLADVAPTVLELLGQEQPAAMTGRSLLRVVVRARPSPSTPATAPPARASCVRRTATCARRPSSRSPRPRRSRRSRSSEVAGLGYEMVLGNTFHLFIQPGHELIAEMGGLHEFMGWDGAIVTDSGGYQVFSMGHGSVAEEIKRRARRAQVAGSSSIEEEGVRFRSYLDGEERFMGPGDLDGDPGRARLGHRAGVRRVHALPRGSRVHGALDGAHAPLARPLHRVARRERARRTSSCSASCRAASTRTCAPSPPPT